MVQDCILCGCHFQYKSMFFLSFPKNSSGVDISQWCEVFRFGLVFFCLVVFFVCFVFFSFSFSFPRKDVIKSLMTEWLTFWNRTGWLLSVSWALITPHLYPDLYWEGTLIPTLAWPRPWINIRSYWEWGDINSTIPLLPQAGGKAMVLASALQDTSQGHRAGAGDAVICCY